MAGIVEIATDADGDLIIEAGDFKRIDGADACAQMIRIALLMIFGELQCDKLVGNKLLAAEEGPMPQEIIAEVRRVILSVPGVGSVGTLTLDVEEAERIANVTGEAFYEDGTAIPIDESVPFGG